MNVYFVYGKTHNGPYPNSTTPQPMAGPGTFQANISSLTPGTIYYFRAKGDGGQYGIASGAEMSFTTSKLPPIVATQDASGVFSDNATLNGNLDSLGNATTVNVSFMWGTQCRRALCQFNAAEGHDSHRGIPGRIKQPAGQYHLLLQGQS